MSNDDENLVYYGTPIEREEEVTTRRKKAKAEASGLLRTALPLWKQEVTDEEGRRRFHGAFTGGFSAGYYNTVGSKEGWTPQSFTSSRKNRADVKKQNIYNFLDEDEKAELDARTVETSMQYDTFGFTAVEVARKQAQAELQQRPATIPGLVPDELIVPSAQSIGVKLLLKMGWRQGRSIKDSNKSALYDARREARKAFMALSENESSLASAPNINEEGLDRDKDLETEDDTKFYKSTPAFVASPKQDLHGLGYDPFKQAPEFREKKRLRTSGDAEAKNSRSYSTKGKMGPGFGIGALEDLDVEDEDVYASGYNFQETYVQEVEEPSHENNRVLQILDKKRHESLPGFKASSKLDKQMERFDPPVIPEDFVPHHKFPPSIGQSCNSGEIPPDVPAPEDSNLRVLIEGVAKLVARCGKLFEDLSREKNQSNPLFGFLIGRNGSDFYSRKLWEEQQKHGEQGKLWEGKRSQKPEKMTAEKRGKILGEKALEASARDSSNSVSIDVQFKLSDTFTKPESAIYQHDIKSRFFNDPEKQKRFEQFLKEKYEGGIRSKDSGGASNLSEAARARERLEFEAAAEAIKKADSVKESASAKASIADFLAPGGLQFTTGSVERDKAKEEIVSKPVSPKREEFDWRPAPILCKRFELTDPYMGKPPPAPRSRSKLDKLILMPSLEVRVSNKQASSSVPQALGGEEILEEINKEVESEVQLENIERPVDLYKAIFSDDSDDEAEITASNQVDDVQKKSEAANTALNRLIAGDFLESLGRELGFEVPPEAKLPENRVDARFSGNGTLDQHSTPAERVKPASQNVIEMENSKDGPIEDGGKGGMQSAKMVRNGQEIADTGGPSGKPGEDSNSRIPTSDKVRNRSHSRDSSSSEENSRKQSRKHRKRRGKSDRSDNESDGQDRGGSSSRRHSKHRKHKRSRSSQKKG